MHPDLHRIRCWNSGFEYAHQTAEVASRLKKTKILHLLHCVIILYSPRKLSIFRTFFKIRFLLFICNRILFLWFRLNIWRCAYLRLGTLLWWDSRSGVLFLDSAVRYCWTVGFLGKGLLWIRSKISLLRCERRTSLKPLHPAL